MTLFRDVSAASHDVSRLPGRLDKVERLARLLAELAPEEVPIAVSWLSGTPSQGRIGVGWALLQGVLHVPPAPSPTLTLSEVDAALGEIARASGVGSRARRLRILESLFARATAPERDFIARLLLGELRQGAQESVVLEAIARASGRAPETIRRAAMLHGHAAGVGRAFLEADGAAPGADSVRLFRPVKPMLASSAGSVREALARLPVAAFEYKLDGGRLQVHKHGTEVRVYTRRLNDETPALPEVVECVMGLAPESLVLDGEALALLPDGTPRPFQETMRRFGRKRDVPALRRALPLTPYFFDVLLLDGESLIDLPAAERFRLLEDAIPPDLRAPRLVTGDAREAEAFLDEALAGGHEGLMAKALDAPYAAGRRGRSWLKIKPSLTADLVVLAAEWGHGRRQGWLSNLHLGARGDEAGSWVMVGKTFKGMTDALLRWQTERLGKLAVGDVPGGVRVRPELVVEVAFEGVQASRRYPGGVALRFARVKGYRPDKAPEEADTLARLREVLRRSG